jgi:anti-anti-sigma factor
MPIGIAVEGGFDDAFMVVVVNGEVDADNCEVLADALTRVARNHRSVIIDLTRVRRLSAAGLHCLGCCVDQLRDEKLKLVSLVCPESSNVREVLRAVSLRRSWPVYTNLDYAVRDLMRHLIEGSDQTDIPPRAQSPVARQKSVTRADSQV